MGDRTLKIDILEYLCHSNKQVENKVLVIKNY